MMRLACFALPLVALSLQTDADCSADGRCAEQDPTNLLQLHSIQRDRVLASTDSASPHLPPLCQAQTTKMCLSSSACDSIPNATCVDRVCTCGGDLCALERACYEYPNFQCRAPRSTVFKRTKPARESNAGARIRITTTLLDYLTGDLLKDVLEAASSMKIPDIIQTLGSADMNASNISLSVDAVASAQFIAGSGIQLNVTGIDVNASAHLKAKVGALASTEGELTARTTANETSLSLVLHLEAGENGHPSAYMSDFSAHIVLNYVNYTDPEHEILAILVVGAILAAGPTMLEGLLKTSIEALVCDKVSPALSGLNLVQKLPVPAPYDVAAIDAHILGIEVTDESIDVLLNGTVLDISGSNFGRSGGPHELPAEVEQGTSMISFAASQWIANNLFWLFQKKDLFVLLIADEDLPANSLVRLNTKTMSKWAPKLKNFPCEPLGVGCWEWRPRPMDIWIRTARLPKVKLVDGQIQLAIDLEWNFDALYNNKTYYAYTLKNSLSLGVSIKVSEETKWPNCEIDTGKKCGWGQCGGSLNAECKKSKCMCKPGDCFVDDTCVPAQEPGRRVPYLYFELITLSIAPFKTVTSQVGTPNVFVLNWALTTLAPLSVGLINSALKTKGVALESDALPIELFNTGTDIGGRAFQAFTDFLLNLDTESTAETIVKAIESQIGDIPPEFGQKYFSGLKKDLEKGKGKNPLP